MTGRVRVLVVDDEPPARDRIVDLLEERPGFEVVGEAGSGPEALEAIRSAGPDLVFLDVQMPGTTGLEVVEALEPDETPAIVFVTAYDEHAVRAFELHALDYLLKPFDDRRFEEALRRARTRTESRRLMEEFVGRVGSLLAAGGPSGEPLRRIIVKEGERSYLVPVDEIDWIEAANYYAVLHTGGRNHVVDETLAGLDRSLDDRFVRIHRSTIVNLERVREFQRLFHGDFAVILTDGTELKLSRTYRKAVEARLGRAL